MAFYENYVILCNKSGKTPSAVAIEIGITKSQVSRWKRGGGATDATMRKIADYFGVSLEMLLGEGDEKQERPPLIPRDEREEKFLAYFRQLSPEQQAREIAYLEAQAGGPAGKDNLPVEHP